MTLRGRIDNNRLCLMFIHPRPHFDHPQSLRRRPADKLIANPLMTDMAML